MGLSKLLKSIFGRPNKAINKANLEDELNSEPVKKLKVRTVDATRDAANLAANTLKISAHKATNSASKAKSNLKGSGNKTIGATEKLLEGMREKAEHVF